MPPSRARPLPRRVKCLHSLSVPLSCRATQESALPHSRILRPARSATEHQKWTSLAFPASRKAPDPHPVPCVSASAPRSLPMRLVAYTWALLSWTIVTILSLPVGLCNWERTKHSWGKLAPYFGRPGASEKGRSPADNLATSYGYYWPAGCASKRHTEVFAASDPFGSARSALTVCAVCAPCAGVTRTWSVPSSASTTAREC